MTDLRSDVDATYQPRTLSDFTVLLMTLLRAADEWQSADSETSGLDAALRVLVDSGRFLPWAWSSWSPENPHYSVIIALVSHKLQTNL